MALLPELLIPGEPLEVAFRKLSKRNRRQRRNLLQPWASSLELTGWTTNGAGVGIDGPDTFHTSIASTAALEFRFNDSLDARAAYLLGQQHGKLMEFSFWAQVLSNESGTLPYLMEASYFDSVGGETKVQQSITAYDTPTFFKLRFTPAQTYAEGSAEPRLRVGNGNTSDAVTIQFWKPRLVEVFERQGG